MSYPIEYSPEALDHLAGLPRHERVIIFDKVDEQLSHEPLIERRHRKRLRPNPIAPWELRLGDFRVFYEVTEQPAAVVNLAVGIKTHNVLRIGGKVVTP